MTRMVHCVKLDKEAEGLDAPTYPGELGQRIFEGVSKEAWQLWLKHQTILINEHRLSPDRSRVAQVSRNGDGKVLFRRRLRRCRVASCHRIS